MAETSPGAIAGILIVYGSYIRLLRIGVPPEIVMVTLGKAGPAVA